MNHASGSCHRPVAGRARHLDGMGARKVSAGAGVPDGDCKESDCGHNGITPRTDNHSAEESQTLHEWDEKAAATNGASSRSQDRGAERFSAPIFTLLTATLGERGSYAPTCQKNEMWNPTLSQPQRIQPSRLETSPETPSGLWLYNDHLQAQE